jgi:hypothetical protein
MFIVNGTIELGDGWKKTKNRCTLQPHHTTIGHISEGV